MSEGIPSKKPTTKKAEVSEVLSLLQDQASIYLDWSWEGTVGYEDNIEQVGAKFGYENIAAIWYDRRSADHAPAYVFLITPIFALSPGSHGLRSLECWLTGNEITGVNNLATLAGVLLAIAIGILLGTMLMSGLRKSFENKKI